MLEYSHDWPVRLTVLSSLLASHEDDGVRKEKERLTAACGTRFLVQRLQGYWQMIRKDLTGRSSANQGRTLWLQRQCNNPVGRCNYRPIRCILLTSSLIQAVNQEEDAIKFTILGFTFSNFHNFLGNLWIIFS